MHSIQNYITTENEKKCFFENQICGKSKQLKNIYSRRYKYNFKKYQLNNNDFFVLKLKFEI